MMSAKASEDALLGGDKPNGAEAHSSGDINLPSHRPIKGRMGGTFPLLKSIGLVTLSLMLM